VTGYVLEHVLHALFRLRCVHYFVLGLGWSTHKVTDYEALTDKNA